MSGKEQSLLRSAELGAFRGAQGDQDDTGAGMFRSAKRGALKATAPVVAPAEGVTGIIEVPIGTIRDLGRSQYLLSCAIPLAHEIATTLKTAEELSGDQWQAAESNPDPAEPQPWRQIRKGVVAIEPLQSTLRSDMAFEDELHVSLGEFQDALREARRQTRRLVDGIGGADEGAPTKDEKKKVRKALYDLVDLLAECEAACRGESKQHVDLMGEKLAPFLTRLKESPEPSAKPAEKKPPAPESSTRPAADNGELPKSFDERSTVTNKAGTREENVPI